MFGAHCAGLPHLPLELELGLAGVAGLRRQLGPVSFPISASPGLAGGELRAFAESNLSQGRALPRTFLDLVH